MSALRKLVLYGQGIAGLRQTDVLLSSFPRSGSTWIRFILCNLISILEWQGQEVDFALLNETMVAFGNNNLTKPWPVQSIPRVVKTHLAYSPLFRDIQSIGVIRDPRDVMVSHYHYRRYRLEQFQGTFPEFIRDPKHGLPGWFRHYLSWRDRWALEVPYQSLRRDVFAEVTQILQVLGVSCPEQALRQAIQRSDIAAVRKVEGSEGGARAGKEARFARDGRTRQWPDYFQPEDLAYFDELCQKHGVDLPALEAVLAGGGAGTAPAETAGGA